MQPEASWNPRVNGANGFSMEESTDGPEKEFYEERASGRDLFPWE